MIDVKGPTYILHLVLATIYESVLDLQLGNVSQRARGGDSSRFGQSLDAFGEVHAIAEYVAVLFVHDNLAEMHADAKHQSLLLAQWLIESRHALLDVDRRRDSGNGRSEFG
jgi:hypothetical protein